ncbi:MAG: hypothetical protein U1E60_24125 [Reyranellaceae bacterium]
MQVLACRRSGIVPTPNAQARDPDFDAYIDRLFHLKNMAGQLTPSRERRFREAIESARADVSRDNCPSALRALDLLSLELCDD